MQCARLLTLIILPTIVGTGSVISADEPTPNAVRDAVAKSLPYIAERGQWWMDEKKCVTCHRVAFTVWTHAAAAGFDVDRNQMNTWVDWSFEALLKKNDEDVVVATRNLDGVAQTLYATRTLALTDTQKAQRIQLLQLLKAGQQDDGSWAVKGTKKNKQDTIQETATYWGTCWAVIGLLESEKER
ncbi:MAG: hypothetical protein ABGZ53_12855 [Fuerstiella sp.]|nr:hypothetical protein [Fuerstiella sp.]